MCVPGGINRTKLSILSEYFKKYLVGLRLSNSAGPYKSPINSLYPAESLSSIRSEFSERFALYIVSFHRSIPPGTHTYKNHSDWPGESIPPGWPAARYRAWMSPGCHPSCIRRTKFIIIYYFFVSPSAGRWHPTLRSKRSWWLSLHKSSKIIKKSLRSKSSWWLSLGKSPKISIFKKFKNTKTIL